MVFLNIAELYGPIAFRQPRSGSVFYFLFFKNFVHSSHTYVVNCVMRFAFYLW